MIRGAPRAPRRGRGDRARSLALLTAGAVTVSTSCVGEPRDSITAPSSPQAVQIDGLWTLSLWMGVAVWVVVMTLLAIPIVRSLRRVPDDHPGEGSAQHDTGSPPGSELDEPMIAADPADHAAARSDAVARSRLLWIGGIIGPAVILLVLVVASGRVGASTAHVEREGELVIEVVGHMFWWEVHYPEQDITTANEIHVPIDRPVRLRLTTEDVIHSFWIPRVHGKIDMIPGTENWLSFEASETGRFRGQCAEFCGIAHAQMVAFLEVQEPGEFDDWVAGQQADVRRPTTPAVAEGERLFLEVGCAACHTVRGSDAVGRVGPDLTHLASRSWLAAGIVPNTRENLAELVTDPWNLKPGNPMPPTRLNDDELDALLDYLESLR